jgi:hypothetical protein
MNIYLVRALNERDDDGAPLWWGDAGWTTLPAASVYTPAEREAYDSPLGGEWVQFQEVAR